MAGDAPREDAPPGASPAIRGPFVARAPGLPYPPGVSRCRPVSLIVASLLVLLLGTPDAGARPSRPTGQSSGSAPGSTGTAGTKIRRVLMIGIDGVRPDALLKAETPTLRRLARQGQVTWDARVVDTTLSGPSWAAFLTGVGIERHGVRNNKFESHRLGETPTFFEHLRVAFPKALLASVVAWQPFQRVLLAHSGLDLNLWRSHDDDVTAQAERILAKQDPTLLLVHLDAVDAAGHKHGYTDGPGPYRSAIETSDVRVGRLLAALKKRKTRAKEDWLVLVTTDHGGAGKGHGGGSLLERRIFIIAHGLGRARSRFRKAQPTLFDVAPTVLSFLGVDPARYADLDGRPLHEASAPARADSDRKLAAP